MAMILRAYHGMSFLTFLSNSNTGYLWNNLPTARIVGASATTNAVYTATVGFSTYPATSSQAHSGLVVYDFDPQGVLRPLITISYQHTVAGQNFENKIVARYVSQDMSQWFTHDLVTNLPSTWMQIGIERNWNEKKWRFFYAVPTVNGGRWTYAQLPWNNFAPWQNPWDVYDNMLPGNMQANATVAFFGANSGAVSTLV